MSAFTHMNMSEMSAFTHTNMSAMNAFTHMNMRAMRAFTAAPKKNCAPGKKATEEWYTAVYSEKLTMGMTPSNAPSTADTLPGGRGTDQHTLPACWGAEGRVNDILPGGQTDG